MRLLDSELTSEAEGIAECTLLCFAYLTQPKLPEEKDKKVKQSDTIVATIGNKVMDHRPEVQQRFVVIAEKPHEPVERTVKPHETMHSLQKLLRIQPQRGRGLWSKLQE